jgi:hypothetical protein
MLTKATAATKAMPPPANQGFADIGSPSDHAHCSSARHGDTVLDHSKADHVGCKWCRLGSNDALSVRIPMKNSCQNEQASKDSDRDAGKRSYYACCYDDGDRNEQF